MSIGRKLIGIFISLTLSVNGVASGVCAVLCELHVCCEPPSVVAQLEPSCGKCATESLGEPALKEGSSGPCCGWDTKQPDPPALISKSDRIVVDLDLDLPGFARLQMPGSELQGQATPIHVLRPPERPPIGGEVIRGPPSD